MPIARHGASPGCPGLFHIVAARDGGLCRIKLARGELSTTQARAVARAAQAHASGIIDITNRANLQLRGVREDAAPMLIQALLDAGLGPLAGEGDRAQAAARDDRRNVMLSPTAGIDTHAWLDTRPLADALLEAMQAQPRFDALSPKFAVLLDGGEALCEREHPHDIWLAALSPTRFAFGIAGAPASGAALLGSVASDQAMTLVIALIHAFLDLRDDGASRLRALADRAGPLLARAVHHGAVFADDPPRAWKPRSNASALRLGIHPQRGERLAYVGMQPPTGRMNAAMLHDVATLADEIGSACLRLTPWQSLLLPGVSEEHAAQAMEQARTSGWLTRLDEPLSQLIACAGSTGCSRSHADTKADAWALAAHGRMPGSVHLSGCDRCCAAAVPAGHTLLAVSPGRYDIYRRHASAGLGPCLATAQTLDQAAALLQQAGQESIDA